MPRIDLTVKLIGEDGNIFNLIGLVRNAMYRASVPREQILEFQKEVILSESHDEALSMARMGVSLSPGPGNPAPSSPGSSLRGRRQEGI